MTNNRNTLLIFGVNQLLVSSILFLILKFTVSPVTLAISLLVSLLVTKCIIDYYIKPSFAVSVEEAVQSTVLITGGTSGIGLELAKLFTRDGFSKIILVSNDTQDVVNSAHEQLQAVIEKNNNNNQSSSAATTTQFTFINKDLTQLEAPKQILQQLQQQNLVVTHLVNCAGFGLVGEFRNMSIDRQLQMLQVNVLALTHMTHLFANVMIQNGIKGKILNVSSSASFQPSPGWICYSASKAYVSSFTLGLSEELKEFGISVTVMCPGATRTKFLQSSGFNNTLISKLSQVTSAEYVASEGYYAMNNKSLITVPGLVNQMLYYTAGLSPTERSLPFIYAAFKRQQSTTTSASQETNNSTKKDQ